MTMLPAASRVVSATAICALAAGVGLLAQKGTSAPPEHASVTPINGLPNPYETVRNFGTLPDGRRWGR
jgi:hypothetical protein